MSRALALSCAAFLLACSSGDFQVAAPADAAALDATTAADASTPGTPTDAPTEDAPPGDGAVSDTAVTDVGGPDGSNVECVVSSDCRLFSSECDQDGLYCVCLALGRDTPDPTCTKGTVDCYVDPCLGRTAVCNAGVCEVQ